MLLYFCCFIKIKNCWTCLFVSWVANSSNFGSTGMLYYHLKRYRKLRGEKRFLWKKNILFLWQVPIGTNTLVNGWMSSILLAFRYQSRSSGVKTTFHRLLMYQTDLCIYWLTVRSSTFNTKGAKEFAPFKLIETALFLLSNFFKFFVFFYIRYRIWKFVISSSTVVFLLFSVFAQELIFFSEWWVCCKKNVEWKKKIFFAKSFNLFCRQWIWSICSECKM